ncbi:hypothetical protein NMG60_11033627 [Bertholletia excelsa]
MAKQGPFYQCDVTTTFLWRKGPLENPMCNACASQWRAKGTLANYTPLYAMAEHDYEFEDYRVSRVKSSSIKNKEVKVVKRKPNHDTVVFGGVAPDYNEPSRKKVKGEDASNRSSAVSAISSSESCVQIGSGDISDLTGLAQSMVWAAKLPTRKRTSVCRPSTSIVIPKLVRDLYTILHEQYSHFSGCSEENLLFESDTPMLNVEIGLGCVLQHPSSIFGEEEFRASSKCKEIHQAK